MMKPLVDVILDKAGQKGTGKWSSKNAFDLGVPLPISTESVFARFISAMKDERVKASKILRGPEVQAYDGDKEELIEAVRKALYLSKICSYAQGFAQMRAQSEESGWDLRYGDIAMIWRGGCIIRAQFLQKIKEAYDREPGLTNLLLDPYFTEIAEGYQDALREVVAVAIKQGIAVPAFSSAIAYFDSYRTADLPANLLQAQRDYFGAHTYERKDKAGSFHTNWIYDLNEKKTPYSIRKEFLFSVKVPNRFQSVIVAQELLKIVESLERMHPSHKNGYRVQIKQSRDND